jgi:hypothetical protein
VTPNDLQHILEGARRRNVEEDISGVLLYADGYFMQYLEGPEAGLHRVYAPSRLMRCTTALSTWCVSPSLRASSLSGRWPAMLSERVAKHCCRTATVCSRAVWLPR